MSQAIQAGVFRFLHTAILTSPAFEDEPLPQKELYAQILNHLSMDFLDAEPGRCVATFPLELRNIPDAEDRVYLVYLKYWTLNLNPLMVYPKVLFHPIFNIKEEHCLARSFPHAALYKRHDTAWLSVSQMFSLHLGSLNLQQL